MLVTELEERIYNKLNELIDVYFNENTLIDNMANTTLKILLDVNKDKISGFLAMFSDSKHDIDAEKIIKLYASNVPEKGIIFDLRTMVNNELAKTFLPDKALIINKEDFLEILKPCSTNE